METPQQLIDKRLIIQEGHHKGAKRTITEQDVIELMEEYHIQHTEDVGLPTKIPYD